MKTNKSYKKRVKVTKNGKVVARKPGQDHFNARESGNDQLKKNRTHIVAWGKNKRITRRFLSNVK